MNHKRRRELRDQLDEIRRNVATRGRPVSGGFIAHSQQDSDIETFAAILDEVLDHLESK